MSKQSEAKLEQLYTTKPVCCGTCIHYSSGFLIKELGNQETNKRCMLGNFAVKKMASCRHHKFK